MATTSRALGGAVISLGNGRSGSLSGNVLRRNQLGPGTNQSTPLGAIIPPSRPAAFFPQGSRGTTVGWTQANASPPRFRFSSVGMVMSRNQLGQPDVRQ